MKNSRSLLMEFLLSDVHGKNDIIEDSSDTDEFIEQVPENDYSGDPLLPDELRGEFSSLDDFIKTVQIKLIVFLRQD